MNIDIKREKKDQQQYAQLSRLASRAEKKAVKFIKKNLHYDFDLQLKNSSRSLKPMFGYSV